MARRKSDGGKSGGAEPRRVFTASLGCAKNLVDTEVMLGALATAGYEITTDPDFADVIIVNTCGFIRDAVMESESVIESFAELKRLNESATLVVAGCLAERARGTLREKYPEIDLLIGTSSYPRIVELLGSGAGSHFAPRAFLHDHTHPRLLATPPWSAYLKIAEGCSNRCSYCTIPSLRGEYRSREPESLAREAAALASIGVRELIVIAQDITRYGADIGKPGALPALLRRLSEIEGLHWIRLMYAYPELVDDALARAIAETPKVCRYLDMPIQHIDEKILAAMNRRGAGAVRRAIETLRNAAPDISLRTTLLVGFPGETDAQFEKLLKFVEEAEFDRLGVFEYSPEPDTPAAAMPRQAPDKIKRKRHNAVMELQKEISLRRNRKFIGSEIELLVEDVIEADEDGPAEIMGRTFRDAPEIDGIAVCEGRASAGEFATVVISGADEYDLYGRIKKDCNYLAK